MAKQKGFGVLLGGGQVLVQEVESNDNNILPATVMVGENKMKLWKWHPSEALANRLADRVRKQGEVTVTKSRRERLAERMAKASSK